MGFEIKGKEVADLMRSQIITTVENFKKMHCRPKVVTVLVEGDPASLYYAQAKEKMAAKMGIEYELQQYPPTISEAILLDKIHHLNEDPNIHGIMLELPLPKHISTDRVTAAISPKKDVDGLTPENKLAVITGDNGIYPATPIACIRLLKHYGYSLEGKNVVLVGRGKTVGLPLIHLLLRENATVTVCHSRTPNLAFHIQKADFTFVAVGHAKLITPEMVHPNLIVIDAGINETEDNSIVGDVDPSVIHYVKGMSPTPGGVGTVTTVQLFANLMQAIEIQMNSLEAKP